MSRKGDRAHVFRLVYEIEFHEPQDYAELFELYFQGLKEPDKVAVDFVRQEYEGVINHLQEVDGLISGAASGWDIKRISKIDLAVMRVAVYEMLFEEEIPQKVSINEAVELGKHYSGEQAPNFINGVLGKIASTRADEKSGEAHEG